MEKISHYRTLQKCISVGVNTTEILSIHSQFHDKLMYIMDRTVINLPSEVTPQIAVIKSEIEFNDAIEYVKSKGGIFSNIEGLKLLIDNFYFEAIIGANSRVYGFDSEQNLWNPENSNPLFVPWMGSYKKKLNWGLSAFAKHLPKASLSNSYILYFT